MAIIHVLLKYQRVTKQTNLTMSYHPLCSQDSVPTSRSSSTSSIPRVSWVSTRSCLGSKAQALFVPSHIYWCAWKCVCGSPSNCMFISENADYEWVAVPKYWSILQINKKLHPGLALSIFLEQNNSQHSPTKTRFERFFSKSMETV